MDFNDYQKESRKTAIYPDIGYNLFYPTLGLSGEAGEVAEKVKKIYRDKNGVYKIDDCIAISKELGDCLWYLSQIASELGLSLNNIAERNIEKLRSRKDRGKLQGDGDNR